LVKLNVDNSYKMSTNNFWKQVKQLCNHNNVDGDITIAETVAYLQEKMGAVPKLMINIDGTTEQFVFYGDQKYFTKNEIAVSSTNHIYYVTNVVRFIIDTSLLNRIVEEFFSNWSPKRAHHTLLELKDYIEPSRFAEVYKLFTDRCKWSMTSVHDIQGDDDDFDDNDSEQRRDVRYDRERAFDKLDLYYGEYEDKKDLNALIEFVKYRPNSISNDVRILAKSVLLAKVTDNLFD